MPVPASPFWPQKAHEWVALVGGGAGALLGISSFVVSLLNYRRDRAKIALVFRARVKVSAAGYDPNALYHVLQVINEGRRDVQIARIDGNFYKGDGFMFTDPVVRGAAVLSEKSPEATFFVEDGGFNLADIWYFSAYDGARREYRLKIHRFPTRWNRALAAWPARMRLRRELRESARKKLDSYEVITAKVGTKREPTIKSRITVEETHAQRMTRLGPLLAAITDVLDHVHHYRQRFTNTFDHHNILQRRPDPALYAPLEAVAGVASTVSVKAHQRVALAIETLKQLDRLQQEVGASLKESAGRGLQGAAAAEVQMTADRHCDALEFHLRPVREEIEHVLADTASP